MRTEQPAQLVEDGSSPAPARPIPPRYWWLKRLALGAGLGVVALGAIHITWAAYAHRQFTGRLAAYRAAGQPTTILDLSSAVLSPARDSAVPLLVRAAALHRNYIPGPPTVPSWRDTLKHSFFDAAQHTLVRQARGRPYGDYPVALSSPLLWVWQPMAFNWARLAGDAARAALHMHSLARDDEAVECVRDALAVARQMRTFPLAHAYGVRLDAEEHTALLLQGIVPWLRVAPENPLDGTWPATRAQVRALLGDFLDETELRAHCQRALETERVVLIDCAPSLAVKLMPAVAPLLAPLAPAFELDAAHGLDALTAGLAAALREDWSTACRLDPVQTDLGDEIDTSPSGLAHMLRRMVSERHIVPFHFRVLALRRCAATALAIRLFELDHGRPPGRLDELVPDYLPAVPRDPFAGAEPLRYQPEAYPPRLYSVHVDGVDQRGRYTPSRLAAERRAPGRPAWDSPDLPFLLGPSPSAESPGEGPNPD